MLVSEIISGGNQYKASSYALNTRLLIEEYNTKLLIIAKQVVNTIRSF